MIQCWSFISLLFLLAVMQSPCSRAFSNDHNGPSSSRGDTKFPDTISRRDYWKVSLGVAGGLAYGKLAGDTLSRISRGIAYPDAHEQRVEATIRTALLSSAAALGGNTLSRPYRILEVGVGSDMRVIRRGLYDSGLSSLGRDSKVSQVQISGVDLKLPSQEATRDVQTKLDDLNSRQPSLSATFDVAAADVTSKLPFADGYFDTVVCCLTLCSVDEQRPALDEIQRLVRSNGGTFGYVEHIAVNPDEPYRFLEWQQRKLDPLQQALADNCHLHRYTEDNIDAVFGVPPKSQLVNRERFLVSDMWPVSCQCCGVIQKQI